MPGSPHAKGEGKWILLALTGRHFTVTQSIFEKRISNHEGHEEDLGNRNLWPLQIFVCFVLFVVK
jgi:hypothetical protein